MAKSNNTQKIRKLLRELVKECSSWEIKPIVDNISHKGYVLSFPKKK